MSRGNHYELHTYSLGRTTTQIIWNGRHVFKKDYKLFITWKYPLECLTYGHQQQVFGTVVIFLNVI